MNNWPSNEWCTLVSTAVNMTPEEVHSSVSKMYSSGKTITEIKNVLVLTALSFGKKLVFVGTKGTN